MLTIYRKLYDILDTRERWLTLIVFIFMILVALLQTVGVASIMPFMAVLANPGVVKTNHYLAAIYTWLDFSSTDQFLFFLGVAFLIIIVGSQVFNGLAFWMQVRFTNTRNHSWSCRLISNYLHQPYDWFLSQHSGTLGASVLHEINKLVHGVLFPAIQLVSNGLVALFLLAIMLVADPVLALTVALVLGVSYAALFYFVLRYIRRIGEDSRIANRERFKVAQEAFGGVKDVKVAGLENIFVERYRVPSLGLMRHEVALKVLSELPSFVMQAVVLGGIMVMLLYFLGRGGGLQKILPIFSLYVFAGYRMMPSLQSIYRYLAEMRYNAPVLETLHPDLRLLQRDTVTTSAEIIPSDKLEPLGLRETLELSDIDYRYPGAERHALKAISMKIPACATVGLVGPTGSGKTTLVDMILGLLQPEKGVISADGKPLTPDMRRAWQRSIGYVPQQIYLSDDTISSNIAFGIPKSRIDLSAVESAARAANLHEFVTNELPQGYNTLVGERGVRLSGGQLQRIGIARALYRNPDILILDEATSALDNLTEQAVMDAVYNLGKKKTIILIAHRLTTVRECDQIFYLEQGRVIAGGTYDELLATNPKFRLMAGAAN
jgi:ABC-type multidrug transport system fused ATPase/permease subunit